MFCRSAPAFSAFLGLWLGSGCVSQDNYLEKTATVFCDRLYECDKSSFEANYSDKKDCVASLVDDYEKADSCQAEECVWDGKAAKSCLSDQADASCDDWASLNWGLDCDEVYTDCDTVDYAVCLAD